MPIDLTFTLRLDIDGHLPNLHPPVKPWYRKARTGSLNEKGWRKQMHAELDAMLDEIAAERTRAREGAKAVPRKGRYYD